MRNAKLDTIHLERAIREASEKFARLEALFCAIRDGFLDADTYEWQLADMGLHTAACSVVELNRIARDSISKHSSRGKEGA